MTKLIVTTSWDDGTLTDLKLGELLEKHGINGTFYVTKSYRNDPLSKKGILELDRKFGIGAHTASHPDLTKLSLPEAEREIRDSKAYLENLTGNSISMFCYPYGRYDGTTKKIVKDCGFTGARTCAPGGFNLPQDPYQGHITLFASNGSPFMALKIWWKSHLWKVGPLLDWEIRAKLLFDLALERGRVYHIYGHSVEFEKNRTWDKLERVLSYISNRDGVRYMTNGEIFKSQHWQEESSEQSNNQKGNRY